MNTLISSTKEVIDMKKLKVYGEKLNPEEEKYIKKKEEKGEIYSVEEIKELEKKWKKKWKRGEKEFLGTVYVDKNNEVVVEEAKDPEFKEKLERLILEVPVVEKTTLEETIKGTRYYRILGRRVDPEDPNYLLHLKDGLFGEICKGYTIISEIVEK